MINTEKKVKVDDILTQKERDAFKAKETDLICKVLDIFNRKRIGSCICSKR